MTSPLRDKLTRLVSEDPAELQQRLDEELRRVRALLTVAAALGWILIVGIVVAYFLDLQGVWDSARTTIATAVGGTVLGALIAGFTVYALLVPRRSNLGRILAVAGGEPEELIRRTTRPVPWRETLATLLPVGLLVTSLVLTAESHPVASHIIPTDVVDDLEAQFDDEEFQQAADLCEQQATAFTNVVGAGLSALGRPHEQIQRELEAAHAEESARLLEAVEWAAVIGLSAFWTGLAVAVARIAKLLRFGAALALRRGAPVLTLSLLALACALPVATYEKHRARLILVDSWAIATGLFDRFRVVGTGSTKPSAKATRRASALAQLATTKNEVDRHIARIRAGNSMDPERSLLRAIERLGELAAREALPTLYTIARDASGDDEFRRAAGAAIARIETARVVVLGHVGHGKAATAAALARALGAAERIVDPDLGCRRYVVATPRHRLTIDAPESNAACIRHLIANTGRIDAAILVVAASDGPMPQTKEHLALARTVGIRTVLPVLTGCDGVDELLLDLVESDARELLVRCDYPEPSTVLRRSSAATAAAAADPDPDVAALIGSLEAAVQRPTPIVDAPFSMPIDRIEGDRVIGRIERGAVQVGDQLTVLAGDTVSNTIITRLERDGLPYERAYAREEVVLQTSPPPSADAPPGSVLAAAGSLHAESRIRVVILTFPNDAGGSSKPLLTGARVRVRVRGVTVPAVLDLESATMCLPGDLARGVLEVSPGLPIEAALPLELIEDDAVVGIGCVASPVPK